MVNKHNWYEEKLGQFEALFFNLVKLLNSALVAAM